MVAVQTRKQELIEDRMQLQARMDARDRSIASHFYRSGFRSSHAHVC